MKIELHDNNRHLDFAPLTLTRPVGNLRVGILTNDERWKLLLPEAEITFETEDYLTEKFPNVANALYVNGCMIPDQSVVEAALQLRGNEMLVTSENWLARMGTGEVLVHYEGEEPIFLKHRWDLYKMNGQIMEKDFELVTKGKVSEPLSSTNTVIGNLDRIFLEKGATVEASILNTTEGSIYIGKNAEIMEGSVVRGGLSMGEDSTLKIGAKMYGPTTIGPHCKVGGEVNNCIFQAYSNKGHDGFLGNSVIGEWCNIGADTNTSNLKNNYGTVKTYSYKTKRQEPTEELFMGLFMGDHSKCGINTMFNTATVVGVSSNLFGAGFPGKYVPSFQWGAAGDKYEFSKAVETANNMMARRGLSLDDEDVKILRFLADKE